MHWTSVSAPFGRVAQAALAAILLVSCSTDNPVGPGGRPGLATLRVRPQFNASARLAPLVMDGVRVIVVRPPADTLAQPAAPFSATATQVSVSANLLLNDVTENLSVTVELYAGSVLLFSGNSTVAVSVGGNNPVTDIPVNYAGPGSTLTSLALSPRDTVAAGGGVFTFAVTALDIQGAPVPDFYVTWSARKGTIGPTGLYTAPLLPGIDTIIVRSPATSTSPQGVEDTTTVTVAAPLPVVPVAISAGGDHTCQISSGTTYCWGDNADGAVGDGSNTDRYVPTPVVGGQNFVAVSAGDFHSCALTAQGAALCWGYNASGELGDGTTTSSNTPVAVGGGHSFVQIAAGEQFTCALDPSGAAWCWGSNWVGQLGDGTTNSSSVPVPVSGGHTFNRITANGIFDANINHACAIDISGAAWCWGSNTSGELGNGFTTGSPVPVAVIGGHSFVDIAAGGEATCAIGTDRVGYCWGLNFGTSLTSPTPVQGSFQFVNTGLSVVMGYSHVCGRSTTQDWVCGGDNSLGQLGDGSAPTDQPVPVRPQGPHVFSMVGTGAYHSCGITSTGTYCWGDNSLGQVGVGDLQTLEFDTPVLVVGPAASVAVSAGNNQFTAPGTEVPFAPAVVVRNATGQGVPGVEVTFTVTLGSGTLLGSVNTETQITNASGVATSSGWILGPSAGTNTMTATVPGGSVVSGNPISFTATGQIAGAGKTWVGTTGNWNLASNWSPAGIPTNTDDVTIPAGTSNAPTLSNAGSAQSVTVNTGATLALGAFTLTVGGNVFADGAITGTGSVAINAAGQLRGNVPNLLLSAPVTLTATTQTTATLVTGNVTVTGATGELIVGDQVLQMTGNLAVQGGALLTMTGTGGSATVTGNASFSGGNELNHLTAGYLIVYGNFTQVGTAGASPESYHATGSHTTILNGTSPTVTFGTPGAGTGFSQFQSVHWTGTGTMTLGSDVYAPGGFSTSSGTAITVTGGAVSGGRLLTTGSFTGTAATTFNNVRLALNATTPTLLALSNVTFQSMPTTSAQLTVSNPGTATAFTFVNVAFITTPTTGFYMDVTDNNVGDQQPLVINMVNPTPATPGGFVRATGGASVVWPFGAGANTWTGSASTDWGSGGNWSKGVPPTVTDDVAIPAGPTNMPALTAASAAKSLTVSTGAVLDLNGFILTVSGNVFADGGVTGLGLLQMNATGQVRGFLSALTVFNGAVVTAVGTTSIGGNFTISGSGTNFVMGGQTVVAGGSLTVTGQLTMTNPADGLSIGGGAGFSGLSEAGLLTDGTLVIGGNLTATGGGGESFAASGNHTTYLSGTAPIVTFASPGTSAGTSRFSRLILAQTGTLTLNSDVYATQEVIATPTGTITITGGATTRLLTTPTYLAPGTATTFDNVRLSLSGGSPSPSLALSNVTFQNLPTTVVQLAVINSGALSPFTFSNVQFLSIPTTGFYLTALDPNPSDGVLTIDMVAPSPTNGLNQAGAPGWSASGATVTWPAVTPARTWTGTVSTDWSDPNNWSPAVLPISASDVGIGPALFQPVLTADVTVNSVTVAGAGASLTIGGHSLTTASLLTHTDGLLVMTNPADLVVVNGDAAFQGGNETGLLSAGELRVAGNFTQQEQTAIQSFRASGTHRTVIVGPGLHTVFFCCSLVGATGFQELDFSQSGGINIQNSVPINVFDTLIVQPGAGPAPMLYTLGNTLTAARLRVDKMVVDRGTLILNEGGVAASQQLDNVVFQNFLTSFNQLAITAVGGAAAPRTLTFNNLTFQPLVSGNTGRYLTVTQSGAGSLVVNLPGGSPAATGPTFTTRSPTNSVTVNWPAVPGTVTWIGTTSTDWSDGRNWSGGAVPNVTDSAIIVTSGFLPALTASVSAGAVEVKSGSLRLNGFKLSVARSFLTSGTGTLIMNGTADTLDVAGAATFDGGSTFGNLSAGTLIVAGDFIQRNTTLATTFAPTGTHKTVLGSSFKHFMAFSSPGAGAAGSHFMILDVSNANGGLQITSNTIIDSLLLALTGKYTGATISGFGLSLTTKQVQVGGLTLDGPRVIINENSSTPCGQAPCLAQKFDTVAFVNQRTDAALAQLTVIGPGSVDPPVQNFRDLQFTHIPDGTTSGALYARLTVTSGGSTGRFLQLPQASESPNAPTFGNGPTFSDPPNQTSVGGALINWP